MSTLDFPSQHSEAHNGFYNAYDASSSFQMNPLSSHPPRISSTAPIYHEAKPEEIPEEPELELEEATLQRVESHVRKEEVWREMFVTSNGRDKAFKIIQYSLKVYLLFHLSVASSRLWRRATRPPWEKELVRRLNSTIDGFSFTRKCLLLFNWLAPLTAIMAQESVPFSTEKSRSKQTPSKPFLHTVMHAPPPVLLELVHAASDDVFTFSKLGLLSRRTGDRAGRFSDWCWLLATLVGLVENGVERQMIGNLQSEVESRLYTDSMATASIKSKSAGSKHDEKELGRLQKQDYWLQITRWKLLMDLVFVSYDVFKIKRARESIKTFTGLVAALLSAAKLYDRHKATLLKAASMSI
ncbi:hypothetical protein MIND_00706700 [Mycena indigotica]|uniref:Uncharacterized protein n=1 Tax=Mycena indigotica TaxID=2126181 RepID=A0A8H6SL96_9AGAR|nr:uncharacterized protein MIND_00706700 [Mycena indigotica]KAF7301414.1 hypothetical protein MIND_00706700 [Mycena indigotica]